MANARIRHYSIFINTKKAATFQTSSLGIQSGDEPQFGDDGFLGYSDGAIQSTLQSDAVVPVGGTNTGLLDALLAKQDVLIGAGIVDGKILQMTHRVLEATYDTDTKTGTLMGKFRFGGGAPKTSV